MKILEEKTFDRYKKNCSVATTESGDYFKSYDTLVAKIDWQERTAKKLGYWSQTTARHINYLARELNLKVIE